MKDKLYARLPIVAVLASIALAVGLTLFLTRDRVAHSAPLPPLKEDQRLQVEKEMGKFQGSWDQDIAHHSVQWQIEGNNIVEITTIYPCWHHLEPEVIAKPHVTRSELRFSIDPTKPVKEIDLIAVVNGKEVRTLGIYEFDGDVLKIAIYPYHQNRTDRPKTFSDEKSVTMKYTR